MKQEFKKTENEIIYWLKKYNIENYTLIPDEKYGFVVDVEDDVYLFNKEIDFIPVKFNIVSGYFDCSYNKLTSLNFCPINIKGSFYCNNNQLTSLKYCPKNVGSNFSCSNNKLISLEFSPTTVSGSFDCSGNKLTSLEHCSKTIGDDFYCLDNKIKNYIYFPEKIEGNVFLNDSNNYTFEEAYKIHLKDKAEYEKEILFDTIDEKYIKDKRKNKI